MRSISFFLNLARPLYLIGSILLYSLGVGVAKYLGITIHWNICFLGLGWILLIQLGCFALYDYIDAARFPQNNHLPASNHASKPQNEEKSDAFARLLICYSCLAVAGSFTVLLIQAGRLTPTNGLMMSIAFFGGIFYSLPPVRLSTSGYGELLISILYANIIPLIAFALQAGEFHRLVAMTTFPLLPLFLAMSIALQFPTYGVDQKYERRVLTVRMGWQNAVNLYNILIPSAYLLLAIAMIYQLPFYVGGPVFLTLPLGFLQIWQMKRITEGAKPNWQALSTSWLVLTFVVVYLLAYSYWIH